MLSLCAALLVGCVAAAPLPSRRTFELRKSEEVFRTFCLRIARDEHPRDPDGLAFADVRHLPGLSSSRVTPASFCASAFFSSKFARRAICTRCACGEPAPCIDSVR